MGYRLLPDFVTCPFCETQQPCKETRPISERRYIAGHMNGLDVCSGSGVAVGRNGVMRHLNMIGFMPEVVGWLMPRLRKNLGMRPSRLTSALRRM